VYRPGVPAGRPLWIDDPHFAIHRHVGVVDIDAPGGEARHSAVRRRGESVRCGRWLAGTAHDELVNPYAAGIPRYQRGPGAVRDLGTPPNRASGSRRQAAAGLDAGRRSACVVLANADSSRRDQHQHPGRHAGAGPVAGSVSWRPALDLNKVTLGGQIVAIVALIAARSIVRIWSTAARRSVLPRGLATHEAVGRRCGRARLLLCPAWISSVGSIASRPSRTQVQHERADVAAVCGRRRGRIVAGRFPAPISVTPLSVTTVRPNADQRALGPLVRAPVLAGRMRRGVRRQRARSHRGVRGPFRLPQTPWSSVSRMRGRSRRWRAVPTGPRRSTPPWRPAQPWYRTR
jgi:hypothetical protein